MLKSLSVKDFAIIEDLTVEFHKGMTVLTGETGAGKSLIIDTISLLLGARADSDMIRYGRTQASVVGIFDYVKELDSLFDSLGIKKEEIKIERIISDSSKNQVKVNGVYITLNSLKQISKYLADIHIQNDTYKLFNPENYLDMLDASSDNNLNKYLNKYSKSLLEYFDALKDYNKVLMGKKNLDERLEFLKYEKEELEALELYPNMNIELNETISRLSNFDKIKEGLVNSYNSLDINNSIDSLYDASKALEAIGEYDKEYMEYASKLLDCYYISDEIKSNIRSSIDNLDYDEDELNHSIEKMNDLSKAMDKYKKNVDELMSYLKEITLMIDMAENYDETLKANKDRVILFFDELKKNSIALSDYRKKMAKSLEKAILKECVDLDLPNTKFMVEVMDIDYSNPFDKSIFKENGCDTINFLISFNEGEPLRPLYKVASGGEASRMMLAFKSYLSKSMNLSLMVFDEIDTGVSGVTASKIANKMHNISKSIQVLCITHLPQVAGMGDYHKHIYKVLDNGRTKTEIKDLYDKDRIEEIAKMLSGDSISLYALSHARELLEKKD